MTDEREMLMSQRTEDAQVRSLVLGYLDQHPTAMDTLDGIADWWIHRQLIDLEVRLLSRVLANLVQDGVLDAYEQDGIQFYRRPARLHRRPVDGLTI